MHFIHQAYSSAPALLQLLISPGSKVSTAWAQCHTARPRVQSTGRPLWPGRMYWPLRARTHIVLGVLRGQLESTLGPGLDHSSCSGACDGTGLDFLHTSLLFLSEFHLQIPTPQLTPLKGPQGSIRSLSVPLLTLGLTSQDHLT